MCILRLLILTQHSAFAIGCISHNRLLCALPVSSYAVICKIDYALLIFAVVLWNYSSVNVAFTFKFGAALFSNHIVTFSAAYPILQLTTDRAQVLSCIQKLMVNLSFEIFCGHGQGFRSSIMTHAMFSRMLLVMRKINPKTSIWPTQSPSLRWYSFGIRRQCPIWPSSTDTWFGDGR